MINSNFSKLGLGFERTGREKNKNLNSGLSLTSLVDCFSVLLIYLLVASTVGGVDLPTPRHMQLPKSSYSDVLAESAVVRIEGEKYFLNNKLVTMDKLIEELRRGQTQFKGMVIQADRRLEFSQLNPIVLIGLAAGYSKIQFAVAKLEEGIGS